MAILPTNLVACHYCDMLHVKQPLGPRERAACHRCGGMLYRGGSEGAVRCVSYSLGAIMLLILASTFPFMDFKIAGRTQEGFLLTGVFNLVEDGYAELAAMVLFTSVLAPLIVLVGILSVCLPVVMGIWPVHLVPTLKIVRHLKAWAMVEVFLLGVLVSAFKLAGMAELVFGPGFFAFLGLMLVSTMALSKFDPDVVWEHIDRKPSR
jgi:paraquat-inducible protein A